MALSAPCSLPSAIGYQPQLPWVFEVCYNSVISHSPEDLDRRALGDVKRRGNDSY